jgi:uncharacterized protein
MRRFDLRSLRFDESGETWRRLSVEVEPFVLGGLEYEVAGGAVDLLLTAARVGENLTLVGEFDADVIGPCQRCLADAEIRVTARSVEYARHGESRFEDDDEDGEEAYVTTNILDLERWVRDLIAQELPQKLLCDSDCKGLCVECGANLNVDPDHRHEAD